MRPVRSVRAAVPADGRMTEKGLDEAGNAFVEIDNLFNTHNIMNVYTNTGQPDNDNTRVGTSGLVTRADELARLDRLYDHDPQNYSLPRTIRTGLEYSF